jgi:hypothetical protein
MTGNDPGGLDALDGYPAEVAAFLKKEGRSLERLVQTEQQRLLARVRNG